MSHLSVRDLSWLAILLLLIFAAAAGYRTWNPLGRLRAAIRGTQNVAKESVERDRQIKELTDGGTK
jgi:hypothetical protein